MQRLMSAAAQKCLLREVFGSDSEEDDKEAVSTCPTANVHGLTHIRRWLSFTQQVYVTLIARPMQ